MTWVWYRTSYQAKILWLSLISCRKLRWRSKCILDSFSQQPTHKSIRCSRQKMLKLKSWPRSKAKSHQIWAAFQDIRPINNNSGERTTTLQTNSRRVKRFSTLPRLIRLRVKMKNFRSFSFKLRPPATQKTQFARLKLMFQVLTTRKSRFR